MILKALYDYYERRKDSLPQSGFEDRDFKFVIVIEKDGRFSHLEDLRSGKGGKNGKTFRVPTLKTPRTSTKFIPNLLWDKYSYVLAQPEAPKKKDPAERAKEEEKNLKNAKKQNEAFVANLRNLPERLREDEGVRAVLLFYEKGEMERVKNEEENPLWDACRKVPGYLTFQLKGETLPVPCHRAVVDYVSATCQDESEEDENKDGAGMPARIGICSATGRKGPLARLMKATKIPGQKQPAALVAIQKSSGYDSYGKEQLFNASLGKETVEACAIALNALLDKDSRNRFCFGPSKDAPPWPLTVLFWVEKTVSSLDLESAVHPMLAQMNEKNAANNTMSMLKMCEAVHKGELPPEAGKIRYYFLGLAPSSVRIMVRFWKTGTVGELAKNITQHFDDLRIIGRDSRFALLSLFAACLRKNKNDTEWMKRIPQDVFIQMLVAILDGAPYPMTILNLCLQRIHAGREKKESGKGPLVTPLRAAILKAYLNRKERNRNPNRKETIGMSYDPNYKNEAYQCGALFAVLEKAQEEASGGEVNATIGDRYYGAASTAPGSVFGALLKLNRAHLTKLRKNKPGRHTQFVKWIGELMQLWDKGFPRHLSPEDQGRFAIGYYQRRQEFFQKQDDSRNDESQDAQPELSLD